jgi:hypothetical protein
VPSGTEKQEGMREATIGGASRHGEGAAHCRREQRGNQTDRLSRSQRLARSRPKWPCRRKRRRTCSLKLQACLPRFHPQRMRALLAPQGSPGCSPAHALNGPHLLPSRIRLGRKGKEETQPTVASMKGSNARLEYLYSVEAVANVEPSVLPMAVVGSSWEVERLLDMGVNPDSFNHDGETAMMLAAIHDHDSVRDTPSCTAKNPDSDKQSRNLGARHTLHPKLKHVAS